MLARFSKYDFWIPGKISDSYRKKSIKKCFFSRSKNFVEKVGKIFFETKNVSKKNRWKSQWKIKFSKCWFFREKNRNFEIFIFHWLFRRFFLRKMFCLEIVFFLLFREIFLISNFFIFVWIFFYINRKFSQESKNHI